MKKWRAVVEYKIVLTTPIIEAETEDSAAERVYEFSLRELLELNGYDEPDVQDLSIYQVGDEDDE